jgi:aryl-alcohol dehydrogenase-like predicted oxidoreductase
MEYSPFSLEIEQASGTNLLETCRELGVAFVCSSPLGPGLLTGSFSTRESISGANDFRAKSFPRSSEENLEANAQLVSQFKVLADKKGCTRSQLAIAWLLKQGDDIIPIPRTKNIKYLEKIGVLSMSILLMTKKQRSERLSKTLRIGLSIHSLIRGFGVCRY